MKVLVTGAGGFIGRALCAKLAERGDCVVPAVRSARGLRNEVAVGNIGPYTDWTTALTGVDNVVHLAARVHIMHDTAADPLEAFRSINTLGTLRLAEQAAATGIKRFIYLSSIKVNGEGSPTPYRETDLPNPQDPYAISKWEAEQGLNDIAKRTGLEVVILRPPLVYGPDVGANFQSLINIVRKGFPLPLSMIRNQRSLLFLGNLVDAIRICMEHPVAANKTYLLSDGDDVSTPELIRRLARAMKRPALLLPVPAALLSFAGSLLGKRKEVSRLLGSLTVDSGPIRRDLAWSPPFTLNEGLRLTVAPFSRV